MANRTDPRAKQIHGTNPQLLIDTIIRQKIYNDPYFKEKCFALTAETLVDRAFELKYIGGTYGGTRRPSPFLCLVLKMLQIQPEEEIVLEFIKNRDYKYIRALGAFYWRLTAPAKQIYNILEPLYSDYRRIAFRNQSGSFEIMHMDEFIDKLIREEIYCDVALPRILKRYQLEEADELGPRISALQIEDEDLQEDKEDEEEKSDEKVGKEEKSLKPVEIDEKAIKQKGRANIDDWNKGKLTQEVLERKDGRDAIQKKNHQSSSSSYYSSSRSRSKDKYRKRDKKEDEKRRHERRRERSNSSQKKNQNNQGNKKQINENSDDYWIELRKKLGMKM